MNRFRDWLYNRFLLTWCREDLVNRNRCLEKKIELLKQENKRLAAYADGMRSALRSRQRIVIQNGGTADEHIDGDKKQ